MAGQGSDTSTLEAATGGFTSTARSPTSVLMSSRANVGERSAPWTTGVATSLPVVSSLSTVSSLSAVSSAVIVSESGNATSSNSAALLPITSSSFSLQENATEVDLEALNTANFSSMMPTIVYLVVLMVVGLVGNMVVFLVYYRRFKPSATRTYVLAMSVCDFIANALALPSEIIDIRYTYTFDFPWPCKCIRFLNSFLTLTSAFVLVAVATDRFQKICRPLKKQQSLRTVRLNVGLCLAASLALSLLFGALNGSQTLPTRVGNSTGITCSVSDQFTDTAFPLVYTLIMAVAFLLCVAIMAICYTVIAVQLWRHKRRQQRGAGLLLGLKATPAAGHAAPTPRAIGDDTSSGPVPHSEAKTSSSAEFTPLKHAPPGGNSGWPPTAGGEQQVLLLSIRNFNYEGPVSSAEDSDEGCFSAGSTTTTCTTSGEVCKEGRAPHSGQRWHTPAAPGRGHAVTGEAEKANKLPEPEAEPISGATDSAQRAVSLSKCRENSGPPHQSQTASAPHTGSHQDRDDPAESAHPLQPANDSPAPRQTLPPRSARDGCAAQRGGVQPGVQKRGTGSKAIPSSTTLMMVVLTATFVINYLPHLVIIAMRALSSSQFQGLTGALLNAYNIGLRSYFMNCAVNSLVYGFCSPRFRQECRLLFSRK